MSAAGLQLCPRYLMLEASGEKTNDVRAYREPDHIAYEDLVALIGPGEAPAQALPQDPSRPCLLRVDGHHLVLMQTDGPEAIGRTMAEVPPFPLIWSGESEEGFHVGPVFAELSDVQVYLDVLDRCRPLADVEALAGTREVPTSAAFWVRHPQRLEAAVTQLLASSEPRRMGVLLESGRTVALGWPADLDPSMPTQTAQLHAWSKGVLYGADELRRDDLGIFHLSALVPHIQPAELAVCTGKGVSPASAAIRMIGESVERMSAWSPAIEPLVPPALLPLPDDRWHVARVAGSPDEPRPGVPVVNLLDPGDIRLAPRELVTLGPFDSDRRFSSDTTGLAAHTTRQEAHRAGLYECIERHNFYPGITHMAPAVRCPELAVALATHSFELASEAVVFTYPERLHAPVAHCFLFDHALGLWTRGTGSGCSMHQAAEAAYSEAAQLLLRLSFEMSAGDKISWEYQGCVDSEALRLLHDYLSAQPAVSTDAFEALSAATDLEGSLHSLRDHGHSAYVHDFPRLFSSWWACRVVVPGFARSQSRASSVGRDLIGDRLPFALPF